MTMEERPDKLPVWASDLSAEITEPSTPKKEQGWVNKEKPPSGYFNWWQNLTYKWVNYLDNAIHAIIEGYMSEINKLMAITKVKYDLITIGLRENLNDYDLNSFKYKLLLNTKDTNGFALINNSLAGNSLVSITYPTSYSSPTAITSGATIFSIRARSWTGSGLSATGGAARMSIQTAEAWTDTAQGSRIAFFTCANGGTTVGSAFLINNSKTTTRYGSESLNANNSYNSGSASLAWANIYSVNALNVTSDIREKEEISTFDLGLSFIKKLAEKNALASWKSKDFEIQDEFEIQELQDEKGNIITEKVQTQYAYKSNHKRRHVGLIAQRVLEAMNDLGISTKDYSLVSIENYKEGQELDPYNKNIGKMNMRYGALIPVLLNTVLELDEKIKDLEEIITEGA